MSHTKGETVLGKDIAGKLQYIGSTSIVLIEQPGSRRLSIATVLTEAIDIDTACKYPVDFQANAHRIVKCCNCHDDLLDNLKMLVALLCHPGSFVSAKDIEKAEVAIAKAVGG